MEKVIQMNYLNMISNLRIMKRQLSTRNTKQISIQVEKKAKRPNSVLTKVAPINWKEIWQGIARMREMKDAAVDTMGCSV